MTLTGLNTINLSTINTFQQVMLFVLMLIGSTIFVSGFVVHLRRMAFESKLKTVIEEAHQNRRNLKISRPLSWSRLSPTERQSQRAILPGTIIPSPSRNNAIPSSHSDIGDNSLCRQGNGAEAAESYDREVFQRSEDQSQQNNDAGSASGSLTPTGQPCSCSERLRSPLDRAPSLADSNAEPLPLVAEVDSERQEQIKPSGNLSPSAEEKDLAADEEHVKFNESVAEEKRLGRRTHRRLLSMQGVGVGRDVTLHPNLEPHSVRVAIQSLPPLKRKATNKYLLSSGFILRNSQFAGLSESDRTRLGGTEYKAVRFLAVLVPLYFVLWQLLGCIAIGAYVASNRADTARQNGLNPWWLGAFNAVSAFNNNGMSLLDANMVAFQTSVYKLLTMGLLILAGNTCYPIFLRLIVWSFWRVIPSSEEWHAFRSTLQFLLDHPRRCYTHLFPSRHTWWLLVVVITLNGIDWVAFEVLNIGNHAITDFSPGIQALTGLFQAVAVRSGGFYVVLIPTVRIGLQVLYVIMMYVSVYPVVITMRNSNVYEERSLGIYADDPSLSGEKRRRGTIFGTLRGQLTGQSIPESRSYFVRQQLRAQLAHDVWCIVLAVLLVMIVEASQFERTPTTFSVFHVIFEVVSAYGCVGISLGVPNDDYSFCGSWSRLSKLILCVVMMRGRHRGLPVAIDKAVLLPNDMHHAAEEEDAHIRLDRTLSRRGLA